MEDIFYLDLHKDELLGWEKEKSRLVVKAMIDGIRGGDDFPAVPVRKREDNKYVLCKDIELPSGLIDGGHHRAIAHYLEKKELKCKLLGETKWNFPSFFSIKEIVLVNQEWF